MKKFMSLLLVIAIVLTFSACGQQDVPQGSDPAVSDATAVGSYYPITVTDQVIINRYRCRYF